MKSFREADAEYTAKHEELESKSFHSKVGAGVGATVAVTCAVLRRSGAGALGCSLVGGATAILSYGQSALIDNRLERLLKLIASTRST